MATVLHDLVQSDGHEEFDGVGVAEAATPLQQRYKALAPGVIRAAADKSSDKVGKLEIGEVIAALRTEDVGGTIRVEFDRGWVSVTAGSGKALLELLE